MRYLALQSVLLLSLAAFPPLALRAQDADTRQGFSKETVSLSWPVKAASLARGGELLVLQSESAPELAIYDVANRELKGRLELPMSEALVTAGREKIFVVDVEAHRVMRYDIDTLELETSRFIPIGVECRSIAMGYDSVGYILINTADTAAEDSICRFSFMDPNTFVVVPLIGTRPGEERLEERTIGLGVNRRGRLEIRSSAKGNLFTSWLFGQQPNGMQTFIPKGRGFSAHHLKRSAGGLHPSPGGSLVFSSIGVFRPDLEPLVVEMPKSSALIPANKGETVLGLGGQTYFSTEARDVFLLPDGIAAGVKVGVEGLSFTFPNPDLLRSFPLDERLWVFADQRLLVHIPQSEPRLDLYSYAQSLEEPEPEEAEAPPATMLAASARIHDDLIHFRGEQLENLSVERGELFPFRYKIPAASTRLYGVFDFGVELPEGLRLFTMIGYGGKSNREYAEDEVKRLTEFYPDLELTDQTLSLIDGQHWGQFIFNGRGEDESRVALFTHSSKKGTYSIIVLGSDSEFAESMGDFEAVIASFRFPPDNFINAFQTQFGPK